MKTGAITALTIFLLLLFTTTVSAADNFSYSYKNPSDADAQEYIIQKTNVEIQEEGTVTYWKPEFGASTKADSTPGTIVYHFNFERTIKSGFLKYWASCYHWWYSQGEASLHISSDGNTWTELAKADSPAEGTASYASYDGLIPEDFLFTTGFFLKVVLYSYGPEAYRGGIYTNTAQHSRFASGSSAPSFEVGVEFDHWIKLAKIKTLTKNDQGEIFQIDQLIPGKLSTVEVHIKNPTGETVESARISVGLKVGGGDIVTIGQTDITIPSDSAYRYFDVHVQTPADTEKDPTGTLLILLHDRSDGALLDTLTDKVLIYTEHFKAITPVFLLISGD